MDDLKLKLVSISLAASMLFSLSSCTLNKNNEYDNQIISEFDNMDFDNINDKFLKSTIRDFISKVSDSDICNQFDLNSFLNTISETHFLKIENQAYYGSYNKDDNIFTYTENDETTILHELVHMLLPKHNNICFDEGLCILFMNEVLGIEDDSYIFNTIITKCILRMLDDNEKVQFLNGDDEVLKNKLSSIVPAYSDAETFIEYANIACFYHGKLENAFYNDSDNEFKNSKDFDVLSSYRTNTRGRVKIYLKKYYNNIISQCDSPIDTLTEMYEMMNLLCLSYETDIENDSEKDYFLEEPINKLVSLYNISDDEMIFADKNALELDGFTYLTSSSNQKVK